MDTVGDGRGEGLVRGQRRSTLLTTDHRADAGIFLLSEVWKEEQLLRTVFNGFAAGRSSFNQGTRSPTYENCVRGNEREFECCLVCRALDARHFVAPVPRFERGWSRAFAIPTLSWPAALCR